MTILMSMMIINGGKRKCKIDKLTQDYENEVCSAASIQQDDTDDEAEQISDDQGFWQSS